MFKRLSQIAFLTGAAHVFTLVALKFLSKNTSAATLSSIGEIDSIFQLLISILGFGLQLSVVRHIAMEKNWKPFYYQAQSARITLGLLMMAIVLFAPLYPACWLFIFAPVFALSGDYALYGRGQPVKAAIWAFCRTFIPALLLIIFVFINKTYLSAAYVSSTVVIFGITGFAISRQLQCKYLLSPVFPALKLYLQNISLGIATVVMYILGLGLLFVASFFYNEQVLAVSYLGLKLYVIFKGIMRIINQSFIKEMIHDEMTLRADELSILVGSSFLGASLIFPKSMITIFFGIQYIAFTGFIILIGLSALVMCIFISFHTRSLFKKKDKIYAKYAAAAAITSIVAVIILSFFRQSPLNIGLALFTGELIFAAGLVYINKDAAILLRIKFLLTSLLCLLLPLIIRYFMDDTFAGLYTGMAMLGGVYIALNYRKLFKTNLNFK
ncbi:hypothetical protein [Agriterribacter sp.]|uniref:hypothetical protein n=1 Tax=Agriterribacter sp. TaxID=2821509 RepID=UPI002C8D0E90|nr:hypothetical protein [Agriterribacter sp.]HRO44689.1 hypothetical protein [Agriterribacter sp.]HRQ16361.1 hypothetical protein [Agriterribacter sp.]